MSTCARPTCSTVRITRTRRSPRRRSDGATETDLYGNDRIGREISGSRDRSDEMGFTQTVDSGNVLVPDKVKPSLDISAVKDA